MTMIKRTLADLKRLGWVFNGDGKCRYCQEELEWWISPAGKSVPFNPMPEAKTKATHHKETCKCQTA